MNDPIEIKPGTPELTYTLTVSERSVLAMLNQQVLGVKLEIYKLNVELEKQLKEADNLESQFSGALAMLAHSHGMAQCEVDPTLSRIYPPKNKQEQHK